MMAVHPNCLSTLSWLMLCQNEFREGIMKAFLIWTKVLGVPPAELTRAISKKVVFE